VLEEESDAGGLLHRTVLVYRPGGDQPVEEIRLDAAGVEIARVQYAFGPTASGNGVIAQRGSSGWRFQHEDQDGSLIGLTDEAGKRVAEFDYLMFGTPVRRGILLDVAGADIDTVDENTPVPGLTRITLTAGAMTADEFAGRELAIAVPSAIADQYRTASVVANGTDTIDVVDGDGLIADGLLNEGAGFVIHAARLATATPAWSYDGLADTSTFEVSGAGFESWLNGGQLTPDVTRPAYLEIIEVDAEGDWVKVQGDATGTSGPADHYRVVPRVGISDESGLAAPPEERYLFRGYRHDPAGQWSSSGGLYTVGARAYDPRIGRPLTSADDWRNEYLPDAWGTLDGLSPPTAAPALAGTAWPTPAYPAQAGKRPEFRYAGPGLRGWFE
jgi:hypothetical protein